VRVDSRLARIAKRQSNPRLRGRRCPMTKRATLEGHRGDGRTALRLNRLSRWVQERIVSGMLAGGPRLRSTPIRH
jgi:hypothetical protein